MFDQEQLAAGKRLLARALAKNPGDPFPVLLELGMTTGDALWMLANYKTDPEVIDERERILTERPELQLESLPTKVDAAALAWDMAFRGPLEDRLKALRLYADIRGYIEKPAATNVNTTVVNRVMKYKDHGNDEDWEAKARKQQAELIKDASGPVTTKH